VPIVLNRSRSRSQAPTTPLSIDGSQSISYSRSKSRSDDSRSPIKKDRSQSPRNRDDSCSLKQSRLASGDGSWSPGDHSQQSRSLRNRDDSCSPKEHSKQSRSPRSRDGSCSPRQSRSPTSRDGSCSPRNHSNQSQSPASRDGSCSPRNHSMQSRPLRSRDGSPKSQSRSLRIRDVSYSPKHRSVTLTTRRNDPKNRYKQSTNRRSDTWTNSNNSRMVCQFQPSTSVRQYQQRDANRFHASGKNTQYSRSNSATPGQDPRSPIQSSNILAYSPMRRSRANQPSNNQTRGFHRLGNRGKRQYQIETQVQEMVTLWNIFYRCKFFASKRGCRFQSNGCRWIHHNATNDDIVVAVQQYWTHGEISDSELFSHFVHNSRGQASCLVVDELVNKLERLHWSRG